MAKKVGQVRWFNSNSNYNWPSTITLDDFSIGTIFPKAVSITQIGIQTLPGTKIYINSSANPIIVGATGIYDLNVEGLTYITNILFDNASLRTIENNDNAYIIIDYIYEME